VWISNLYPEGPKVDLLEWEQIRGVTFKLQSRMRPVLMCDFDGTIVSVDTGMLILSKFSQGDWRYYDDLYNRCEMPVEEVLRHQFSMVKATKSSMLRAIEGSAPFRPGFERLLQVCRQRGVPLLVVSYGLDFCIKHILGKVSHDSNPRVYAPKAKVAPDGIRFTFPRRRSRGSANLKDDMVRYYRRRGYKVAYVGDGTSDFPALKSADVRFAVRGSRLAELCDSNGVRFTPITSFGPVTDEVVSLSAA
jgi:2-hydroxy-3-keto-5-methylthiopentenyl-1-phosphate phosphatase